MPAQWWSLTVYANDSYLPINEDNALSFDASRAGDGAWQVTIAPEPPHPDAETNWISNREAGQFDVTLRLYVPDQALLDDPEGTLTPPALYRGVCWE